MQQEPKSDERRELLKTISPPRKSKQPERCKDTVDWVDELKGLEKSDADLE